MQSVETNNDSEPSSASNLESTSKSLGQKLQARRIRWEWNNRLLWISGWIAGLLFVASGISYFYHSNKTAETFLAQAKLAEEHGRLDQKAKCLSRYSMLRPDDENIIVEMALAADAAADSVKSRENSFTDNDARKYLSVAIGRLNDSNLGKVKLRKLLINRLLQLGGPWYREAERQVIKLSAEEHDPEGLKWMAKALVGQVNEGLHEATSEKPMEEPGYWRALLSKKIGEVLFEAVDANPSDRELMGSLVELSDTNPDMFATASKETQPAVEPLDDRIRKRLSVLDDQIDSHTVLIRYRFDKNQGDASRALDRLAEFAEPAIQRLEAISSANPTRSTDVSPPLRILPPEYWDFVLVSEYASRISGRSYELARDFYDRLIQCKIDSVPNSTLESVYARFGQLEIVNKHEDKALEIWHQGLDEVNPNSLSLLGSIAQVEIARSSSAFTANRRPNGDKETMSATAIKSLDQFRKAILDSTEQLTIAAERDMTRAKRRELGREIEAAGWRLNVLEAVSDYYAGQIKLAIRRHQLALSSDAVDVKPGERLNVALKLAFLHQQQGSWDAASTVLEQAVGMAPGDSQLRAQVAECWDRAGNRLRAIEHWRVAGNSNLLVLQISSVEALLNFQLGLPPSDRDFSGVRSTIKRIRNNSRFPSATDDLNDQTDVQQAIRQFEIVEMLVPPAGVQAETHLESPKLAQSIGGLAQKYPDDERLQIYAAERYAAAGDTEKSEEVLTRLDNSSEAATRNVAIVRAKINASQGRFREAYDSLTALAKESSSENERLLRMAALYASQGQDTELAYQALVAIPESNRSFSTLFLISKVAAQLDEDCDLVRSEQVSPEALAQRWRDDLQELEGEDGTYWRFLDAKKLVYELRVSPNKIERNDPRLIEAQRIVTEILIKRSKWGDAISLDGRLSIVKGNGEQAIERLRQGIAAGDDRQTTRQLLKEQLIAENRTEEAKEVIRKSQWSSVQTIDKYSTTLIQLAQREGDYTESLNLARTSAKNRPNDFLAHVVHGITAIMVAKESSDEERQSLLAEAKRAIETADSLSDADQYSILSASLSLASEQKDDEAVRLQIERIKNCDLEELDRLLLMSRGLIDIEDYDAALKLLDRTDEIRPSSKTQLAMASLYRKLKQPDRYIEALRQAHLYDPNSADLRNKLAMAIATRDEKDIDWDELKELLQSDDLSTGVNRLLYAIMLGVHGDAARQNQSITMLDEIIKEQNSQSNDAARLLAVLLRKRIDALAKNKTETPEDKDQLTSMIDRVRRLYDALSRVSPVEPVDLYRYADFLMSRGGDDDLVRVGLVLERLQSANDSTIAALNIEMRYLKKTGRHDELPMAIEDWAGDAAADGTMEGKDISSIAAAALIGMGFIDEGLKRLELGYRDDPRLCSNYVVMLNKVGRAEEAMTVCVAHHKVHEDVESVILLTETMLNAMNLITPERRALVEKTVQLHKENALLLEGVATLRLQEEDYDKAVVLYHLIDQIDQNATKRIRTLNNLAMAYSELPGRQANGIEPIERAIKLAGEHPELLDTLGVVLLRSGKFEQAEQIFQKATGKSEEPRIQFHLIIALWKQNKESDAKVLWNALDFEKLDVKSLTRTGREDFELIKEKFGS